MKAFFLDVGGYDDIRQQVGVEGVTEFLANTWTGRTDDSPYDEAGDGPSLVQRARAMAAMLSRDTGNNADFKLQQGDFGEFDSSIPSSLNKGIDTLKRAMLMGDADAIAKVRYVLQFVV
jgi:hypothetical protein